MKQVKLGNYAIVNESMDWSVFYPEHCAPPPLHRWLFLGGSFRALDPDVGGGKLRHRRDLPRACSLAHSPAKGTQDPMGNDQTEDETPLPCVLPCWSLCLAWRRTIITRLT
jgi:hypothetical protein